jgi:Mrp family chromosome partitioning ATPase
VILDLPPVGEVSDALAIAKRIDGMLLVVRQNYCNRVAVRGAVRQFAFMDCKILGVVCNGATEGNGIYGKKYYKKYGKYGKYGSRYAYSAAHEASRKTSTDSGEQA